MVWREQDRKVAGARFRLFPQAPFLHPELPPETVEISTPRRLIGPGPSDSRMYVIRPLGKRGAYGPAPRRGGAPVLDLPPWRGPILRPVQHDGEGNFDHIPVEAPEFVEAHVFGVVRFVLDVWEGYFGRAIPWHFARDYERLEIAVQPGLDNALMGYGFMEIGADHRPDGRLYPFGLNFDVVAHELGHLVIYSTIGVPRPQAWEGEYFGFQESAADTVALIAALHFDSVVDRLLAETRGNLYALNELNRFAELSANEQVRLASNPAKLGDFAAGWTDEHELAQPLTGALFDILVDLFQDGLVARGLIPPALAELADRVEKEPASEPLIQAAFDEAYPERAEGFRATLIEARDTLGVLVAGTWQRLSPDYFSYLEVGRTLLAVDRALTGGRNRRQIVENFEWREIGRARIGPRLVPPDAASHSHSVRTLVPGMAPRSRGQSFRERMVRA